MFLAEGREQGPGHWGGEMGIQGLLILASSSLIAKEIMKFPLKILPPHASNLKSALPRALQEVLGIWRLVPLQSKELWLLDIR